jgi:hypothetical protein
LGAAFPRPRRLDRERHQAILNVPGSAGLEIGANAPDRLEAVA